MAEDTVQAIAEERGVSVPIRMVGLDSCEENVTIHRSNRNDIRLRSPILHLEVSDADRDGVFVVSDVFSSVYGAGDTPGSAIDDYLNNLYCHFDELDRDEDRLGPGLKRELASLRRYLQRCG